MKIQASTARVCGASHGARWRGPRVGCRKTAASGLDLLRPHRLFRASAPAFRSNRSPARAAPCRAAAVKERSRQMRINPGTKQLSARRKPQPAPSPRQRITNPGVRLPGRGRSVHSHSDCYVPLSLWHNDSFLRMSSRGEFDGCAAEARKKASACSPQSTPQASWKRVAEKFCGILQQVWDLRGAAPVKSLDHAILSWLQ